MSKFCTNCGASLNDDTKFCTECGAALEVVESPPAAPAPAAAPAAAQPAPAAAAKPKKEKKARPVYEDGDAPAPGSKYEPISTGGFIGISLLLCIPLVGIIIAIIWAVGGCRKINKRNFARAMLIMMAVGLVFSLILGFVFKALFRNALESIEQETGIHISQDDESDEEDGADGLAGLLGGLAGLGGGSENATNADIEELEELQQLLEGLEGLEGGTDGEGNGLDDLLDGAIDANREAEALNDGWPATLREYPGGKATATASYRTEITDTTLEEMMGWIEALKGDGFVYQDFYDFGMSEEDMLGMNGWWAYDGNTYLSVSYIDGTVIVDHTKELPDLSGLFG